MTDARLREQLSRTLGQISEEIRLRDFSDKEANMPTRRASYINGDWLVPLPMQGITLTCPAMEPGAEKQLMLAAALAEEIAARYSGNDSPEGRWRRRLLGEEEADGLPNTPHCLLALRIRGSTPVGLLRELVPLESGDVLIEMDYATAALIKDLSGKHGKADLIEFSAALRDTLMAEAGCELDLGIGDPFTGSEPMVNGWRQAIGALEIGQCFHPERHIFIWSGLVVERMLSEIEPERAEAYADTLFNRRTARLFDEEMLDTIETFLDTDLNLSDTARKLYIHRNTLVYRLDKVQRQTGLDLRKFDHAVTFSLLFSLRRGMTLWHDNTNRRIP